LEDKGPKEPELSHYEYSGIDERHGVVPKWLLFVYAALLIWMVYYLVHYWTNQG
jgi:N-terminal domain of cytochrome oxidase-cbb3, FixP